MSVIPSKKDNIDDAEAPIETIEKIDAMLKTVINKTHGILV